MASRTGAAGSGGCCHRSTTVHPKSWQLKRMVRRILQEAGNDRAVTVTEILNSIRSRCPHWAVTYRYVRKVFAIAQREKEEEGDAAKCRLFPHDLVEKRHGQRKSRRCWRGQVYRVAELADSDSEEELPAGYCKVQWLGENLKALDADDATSTSKVTALRLIDRPFVIGDRVARVQDPESLGLVVKVKSGICFSSMENVPYPEVPASSVRPVGGFRTEDIVAHEQTRWVGRVEEALYNVEVEVRKRQGSASGGRSVGRCRFQVCSSEGQSMLDAALDYSGNQMSWQEMCPHFTGQKVQAGAKVWREAEWPKRMPKWLNKSFNGYKVLEGTVTRVELHMLGVRWCDSWGKDIIGHNMPAEWVSPSTVTRLELPDSPSEGWALGEHAQAILPGSSPCQAVNAVHPCGRSAILTKTRTSVTVKWADGKLEEDLPSTQLLPRQEFYSHDFLPHDMVARSSDADEEWRPETLQHMVNHQASQTDELDALINEGYPDYSGHISDAFRNFLGQVEEEDIIPTNSYVTSPQQPRQGSAASRVPLGVVESVNLQARTAVVQWKSSHRENPQEVSLFELAPHPYLEIRLGDIVFIPPDLVVDAGHWIGRVVGVENFTVQVCLGNGAVRPFDLHVLRVASCEVMEEGESEAEGPTHAESPRPPEDSKVGTTPLEKPSDASSEEEEQEEGEAEDPPASLWHEAAELEMQTGGSSSSTSRPESLALDTFDEDHEPSDHKFVDRPSPAPKALMRAVKREMTVLRKGLLDGEEGVVAPILVRTYASRSDLFRAMVVGPPGTPYADVPFFFDLQITPQYPAEPPRVHYLAQFASSGERLNPNLYCDGKVCLSLLGTWQGPGWDPAKSTLLQVLLSLQGLVLVEDPYFNEPGHESDAKSDHGKNASALYNENVRLLCLRAALKIHQQPPRGFEEVVARHFSVHGPKLLAQCEEDLRGQGSEGFRQVLSRSILPSLRERWQKK